MRRVLKWLAIGIAGVIAAVILFVLAGYLLPAEAVLDLEENLAAPPEALFSLFTTIDGVDRWWSEATSVMGGDFAVTHVDGPDHGVGMEVGFGAPGGPVLERWIYTSAESPTRVEIDVDFQIFVSHRVLELTPEGTGTRVHWRETARVDSPIWRWLLKLNTASNLENRHTVLIAAGNAAAP